MSSIVLSGDTSGSVTVSVPAVSGSNTVTIPAVTGTVMVSSNMPAFSVYLNGSQTLSSGVNTKILYDTELWDTNNNFASSRFTPTVAGYYQINAQVEVGGSATRVIAFIYKNGSLYQQGGDVHPSTAIYTGGVNGIVYCNGSTDYIEIYAYFATGQVVSTGQAYTYVNGAMVRSA